VLIGDEMVFTDDVDVALELIALGHMARELVMVLGKTL
jgi:hypothetical protein